MGDPRPIAAPEGPRPRTSLHGRDISLEEVVSFGRYVGTHGKTKRSVTAPFAHRWAVRQGRIVRFVQYTDTAKVLEATVS